MGEEYFKQIIEKEKAHNKNIDHNAFCADLSEIVEQFISLVRLYGYEGIVSISVDGSGYYSVLGSGLDVYHHPSKEKGVA